MNRTRVIAGQRITLTVHKLYLAGRPFIAPRVWRREGSAIVPRWPVWLFPTRGDGQWDLDNPIKLPQLAALPKEKADRFVRTFNNGNQCSFTGRCWE